MFSEFASKFCLDFFEIQWLKGSTWTPLNLGFVPYDAGAEGFGEAAYRLAKISLEEFYHRRREV